MVCIFVRGVELGVATVWVCGAHQMAMTERIVRDALSQWRCFFSAAATPAAAVAAGAAAASASSAGPVAPPACDLMRGVTGSAPVCTSTLMTGFWLNSLRHKQGARDAFRFTANSKT